MTSAAADRAGRLPRWLFHGLWLILTVALVVFSRGLPWQQAIEEVSRIGAAWPLAAVAANVVILPLWAAEWRLLAPPALRIPFARMLEVVAVTASILNSIPFLVGEASGVAMLIARGGLSRGAALSVLAMDQLLVGFAKLAVLAGAAVAAPLPAWLRAGIVALVIGVVALVSALLVLAHRWSVIRDRLLARPSRARELAARLLEWGMHLDALRDRGRMWRLALVALAKKAAELLAILAIQAAFGLEPSLASGLLVLAALAITTLLPVAPANLGVYEATVFATYRYLGVQADTALGLAIVQHLCFLLPMLATGYLMLTLRQRPPLRPRA